MVEAAFQGPQYPELNFESRALLDRLGQELKATDSAEIVRVRSKCCYPVNIAVQLELTSSLK